MKAVRRDAGWRSTELQEAPMSGLEPPITVVVPAYNEEQTIVTSVRSMLQLRYPEYEVVVVNEKFGIRLTDVISPAERIRKLK